MCRPDWSNVVAIAAGFDISGALKSDGSVTAWGYSGYGGTAAPGGLTDGVAIAMGHHHGLVLRSNGVVVAWGTTAPPGLTNVLKIAAKQTWSMVLKADGMLVAWNDGVGSQHQVPNQRLTNVLDIAAGCYTVRSWWGMARRNRSGFCQASPTWQRARCHSRAKRLARSRFFTSGSSTVRTCREPTHPR